MLKLPYSVHNGAKRYVCSLGCPFWKRVETEDKTDLICRCLLMSKNLGTNIHAVC